MIMQCTQEMQYRALSNDLSALTNQSATPRRGAGCACASCVCRNLGRVGLNVLKGLQSLYHLPAQLSSALLALLLAPCP